MMMLGGLNMNKDNEPIVIGSNSDMLLNDDIVHIV